MGCCTLTTLNKVNIKGVEYEIGGSDNYRTTESEVTCEYYHEEETMHVCFDFDTNETATFKIDWTKPVRIDVFDEENENITASFIMGGNDYGIYIGVKLLKREEEFMVQDKIDGATLNNAYSDNWIVLMFYAYEEKDDEIVDAVFDGFFSGTRKIIVHYVPVNEYSPILQAEL